MTLPNMWLKYGGMGPLGKTGSEQARGDGCLGRALPSIRGSRQQVEHEENWEPLFQKTCQKRIGEENRLKKNATIEIQRERRKKRKCSKLKIIYSEICPGYPVMVMFRMLLRFFLVPFLAYSQKCQQWGLPYRVYEEEFTWVVIPGARYVKCVHMLEWSLWCSKSPGWTLCPSVPPHLSSVVIFRLAW